MPNNQEVEFFWFQYNKPRGYNAESWGWDLYDEGTKRRYAHVFNAIKMDSQVLCYHIEKQNIIGRFIVIGKTNDSCYLKLEEEMNIQMSDEICKEVYNKKDENGKCYPIDKDYQLNQATYFILNRAQFEYLCSLKENK